MNGPRGAGPRGPRADSLAQAIRLPKGAPAHLRRRCLLASALVVIAVPTTVASAVRLAPAVVLLAGRPRDVPLPAVLEHLALLLRLALEGLALVTVALANLRPHVGPGLAFFANL